MAAITLVQGHDLSPDDLQNLYRRCETSLPGYTIPRFLRIVPAMPMTSTFKQRKVDYVKEGFDLDSCGGDKLYVMDVTHRTYSPVTAEILTAIQGGHIKL